MSIFTEYGWLSGYDAAEAAGVVVIMGRTMTEQIIGEHTTGDVAKGETLTVDVDKALLQDGGLKAHVRTHGTLDLE